MKTLDDIKRETVEKIYPGHDDTYRDYRHVIKETIDCLHEQGYLSVWQNIETAPKDGTHVLLINGEKGGYGGYCGASQNAYNIGVGYFEQYKNGTHDWLAADCCDGASTYFPTHWMPLPKAEG